MAHARLTALPLARALVALAVAIARAGFAACAACSGAPSQLPTPAAAPARTAAVEFPGDPRLLPRYHSKRLELSLPLPDGPSWRIDDRSRPELVATHAPTRSRVMVARLRSDGLVGRRECEAMARDHKLVPESALQTVENAVDITQQNYDTRIWVALEPGAGVGAPLTGHVMAFGGFLRKCYVFDFSTQVDGVADEPVLSSRLAFARARILGGLELDAFGVVAREGGPQGGAPTPAPSGAPAAQP